MSTISTTLLVVLLGYDKSTIINSIHRRNLSSQTIIHVVNKPVLTGHLNQLGGEKPLLHIKLQMHNYNHYMG